VSRARLPIKRNIVPGGLYYRQDFLSLAEEKVLLGHFEQLPFRNYIHGEYTAKRMIVHFGKTFYNPEESVDIEKIPEWLQGLRKRCAELVHVEQAQFEQILVAHYPPGAAVGWHRDAPQYGPAVIGISLGSNANLRFRRFDNEKQSIFTLEAQRRSLYIFAGESRRLWQHSVQAVKNSRFSITFRTLESSGLEFDWLDELEELKPYRLKPSVNDQVQAKQLSLF
jgi:alkylated DNA repair dioxygenase AlkB